MVFLIFFQLQSAERYFDEQTHFESYAMPQPFNARIHRTTGTGARSIVSGSDEIGREDTDITVRAVPTST